MSQTLDRGLSILGFVAERPRRINEIATFLGVHHSTALRLLHTLRGQGFVHELPDHQYRLGSATFQLAFQALEALDLRSVVRPYMDQLNEKSGETVHLGMLEDGQVVFVDKVEAGHAVRMHSRIGGIAPLHCTAIAKAILALLPSEEVNRLLKTHKFTRFTDHTLTTARALRADLEGTRARGYAINNEEQEVGIRSIAAPILGGDNHVAGAISLSAPVSRVDRKALLDLVPALFEATDQGSRELGWRGHAGVIEEHTRDRLRMGA
jgi:DNA-binding IclR family transcriptional regulator